MSVNQLELLYFRIRTPLLTGYEYSLYCMAARGYIFSIPQFTTRKLHWFYSDRKSKLTNIALTKRQLMDVLHLLN